MKILRALSCFLAVVATTAPLTLQAAHSKRYIALVATRRQLRHHPLARRPNCPPGAPSIWNYELGTLLEGMDAIYLNSADPSYFNYIKSLSTPSSPPTAPSPL